MNEHDLERAEKLFPAVNPAENTVTPDIMAQVSTNQIPADGVSIRIIDGKRYIAHDVAKVAVFNRNIAEAERNRRGSRG